MRCAKLNHQILVHADESVSLGDATVKTKVTVHSRYVKTTHKKLAFWLTLDGLLTCSPM